jgi:hypothetical protein
VNASDSDEYGEVPRGSGVFLANLSDKIDFPTIKLGHLKLVEEVAKQNIVEYRKVLHKKTKVVKRHIREVVGVRRIYVACVHGSQEDFTTVVYKGSDFEKASDLTILVEWWSSENSTAPGPCRTARRIPVQYFLPSIGSNYLTSYLRDPSLIQLFGVTSSTRLKALIYYDGK